MNLMPKVSFSKLRKQLFPYALLFLVGVSFGLGYKYYKAKAEQSGSSNESGATSYIKTIYDSLFALSYGSDSAGSWGDWGAYWNRIRSAGEKPFNDAVAEGLWNGTGAGTATCTGDDWANNCYTKAKGGVDDYNNNQHPAPADSYQGSWTPCVPGVTNYCGTGRAVAETKDENTGLVWSPRITTGSWFTANNCKYPNGLTNDTDGDNLCDDATDVRSCMCIKHTGIGADTKTGCENYDDGNWRLPTQKELMQAYIDGSRDNLTTPGAYYWSATTHSTNTRYAWSTALSGGYTTGTTKTTTGYSIRCVR